MAPQSRVEEVVCLSTPLLLPCLQTLVSYQPDSGRCLGLIYLEAKFQDNQSGARGGSINIRIPCILSAACVGAASESGDGWEWF